MAWTTPRWLQSVLGANAAPADPAAALDLAARELASLAERLPAYLDEVREETRATASARASALHRDSVQILQQVDRRLAALGDAASPAQRDRAADLSARSQLLRSLGDAVREQTEVIGRAGRSGEVAALSASLAEALHVILLTAADAIREPDAMNVEMLGQLTGDRNAVMDRIRQGLVRGERTLTVDEHHVLFTSTALFERIIRLLRRFQEGLGRERR